MKPSSPYSAFCRCGNAATHRAVLNGVTVRSCSIHAHADVLALKARFQR